MYAIPTYSSQVWKLVLIVSWTFKNQSKLSPYQEDQNKKYENKIYAYINQTTSSRTINGHQNGPWKRIRQKPRNQTPLISPKVYSKVYMIEERKECGLDNFQCCWEIKTMNSNYSTTNFIKTKKTQSLNNKLL